MSLNVATFVPEGIVISSDRLSFVRNEDEGYATISERTFCLWNRYVVSFVGGGYISGLPYGYYVNLFISNNKNEDFENIMAIIEKLKDFLSMYILVF